MSPVGLLVLVEKCPIIKFGVVLAMCMKLHFAQLFEISVKSNNFDFSIFMGSSPLQIFGFFFALTFYKWTTKNQGFPT